VLVCRYTIQYPLLAMQIKSFIEKYKRILVPGAMVLVLVGGTAYLMSPTRILERAAVNLAELKTAKFNANLIMTNSEATQQLLGESGVVEVSLDGLLDRRGETRDALMATIILKTKTESVSVQVEGETRFVNDQVYLYVTKSPKVFPLLVQLKGQWLEFNRGGVVAGASSEEGNKSLFTNVKRGQVEKIDGISTIKYKANANDDGVLALMDNVAEIFGTQLTEGQIGAIRQSIVQAGEVPVEIWIKKLSSEIVRLKAHIAVPGGNTVEFTLTLQDRNKPVAIEVPDGAVTIAEAAKAIQNK
jgi:hypothetical protein